MAIKNFTIPTGLDVVGAITATTTVTANGVVLTGNTGTVTSVGGTGTVNGITLSGTVTSSGTLTLGGALSAVSLATQVTGTLPIANGGTGTASPGLIAGTNVSITGSWPNQTINASGGGGGSSFSSVAFNDVSTQTNGLKSVFALKIDQNSIGNIADSKNLEVLVNGRKLAYYINEQRFPWITPYDSYKGFRVVSRGSAAQSVVVYRTPEIGSEVVITQVNTSTDKQLRKYPYSAATIALGD